ncbi:MAG: hypothetical protein QOG99_909 [Frankiales bacterium]|nr:hypothetical protein [Frankiales bacterium]
MTVFLVTAAGIATDSAAPDGRATQAVLATVCVVLATRFARVGITITEEAVTARNALWTVREHPKAVVSVGLESRWYLKTYGALAVLRLLSGRRVACIGLSGLGRRTDQKVTEIATILGVPRIDGQVRLAATYADRSHHP